jgi:hypothetical protein
MDIVSSKFTDEESRHYRLRYGARFCYRLAERIAGYAQQVGGTGLVYRVAIEA